jgi:glycosyltransferase involved in cell wall biosynthesis
MTKPQVTAITLVYNTGEFVVETIKSIKSNNYENIQHIIIDDCSTNLESLNVLESYINDTKYNCLFIKNISNIGICASLNLALSHSTGKYLFLLFDDIIVENKIKTDVSLFEKLGSNFALIHSKLQYFDSKSGNLIDKVHPDHHVIKKIGSNYSLNNLLYFGGIIAAPTVMFRTEVLKLVGGWSEKYIYEDTPMWFRLSELGYEFCFRDEITTLYRRHPIQITSTTSIFRHESLMNELRLYIDYLKYPGAQKHLILFFYSCVINDVKSIDIALNEYKFSKGSNIFIYLIFKYPFWRGPIRVLNALKWKS